VKRAITVLVMGFLLSQCSIDRTIPKLSQSEIQNLQAFENLNPKSQLRLSEITEPGQKLWLCLSFISRETKRPLIKEEISLYHTSAKGEYQAKDPNDETSARLSGTVFTDDKGRVFIRTILPGDYGSSADNRHIHTTVKNAKPVAYDIYFKQYTGRMGQNFINGSDQHFLTNLKQLEDSTLITFLTIEVKNYQKEN